MTAFGAILGLSVSAGVPWPGIPNLVMGVVFGFSLVIILISGASLVTADIVLGITGIFHKRISWLQFLLFIVVSYIGNAIGSMMVSLLVYFGGSGHSTASWLLRARQIAASKTGLTDLQAFAMGIFCTWILQTAVVLFFLMRSETGKITIAYYGPLAFVAGMTEHCIANIGFIALPILQQTFFSEITGKVLTAAGPTAQLSWEFSQYGWAHNQIFTLMGNFVGGAVLVGLMIHFISNPHRVMLLYKSFI
ncbi:formate/nitrite transporter family protein [Neobacillus mesonae]|nr:formate/nitrite transporter family protein [Neobacillus mesonae]